MGLLNIFKSGISEKQSAELASKIAKEYAGALSNLTAFMDSSLPAINPDGANYYQLFKTIGAVYEVTDSITKKALACPIVAYKVKDSKKLRQSKAAQKTDSVQAYILKMQAIEEVDIPELKSLLTTGMANPYQTGSQLMWTIVLCYLLYGNSYLYANKTGKKVKELWCIPNMEIRVDNQDLLDPIRGYRMTQGNSSYGGIQVDFTIDEIQHIKTGNPAPIDISMEYLYGVAPLRAYLEPMRTIKEGKRQGSKQMKSAMVAGLISPKEKIDEWDKDQRKQFHDKLKQARDSEDELARLIPSSMALEYQQIGLTADDLNLLEIVGASEEDIYRAFHWSLQNHNQKASTSNNEASAAKKDIYNAVAPVCDVIGEALTIFLGPGFGDVIIELDYTQLPEMAVLMRDVAAYLSALPMHVLSPNEMRVILKYGELKEDYMNAHYVASNITTLKRVYDGEVTPQNITS